MAQRHALGEGQWEPIEELEEEESKKQKPDLDEDEVMNYFANDYDQVDVLSQRSDEPSEVWSEEYYNQR